MLLTKSVFTKWNSGTKRHYESLGYQYTKMGEILEVKVEDLPRGSSEKVDVQCDYCEKIYKVVWAHRTKIVDESPVQKDCCFDCKNKKAFEVFEKVYGVQNIMDVPEVRAKRDQTILDRYGFSNQFQNEDVKNKIKKTNLEKYGEDHYNKTEEAKEKHKKTCLEKYGYESWMCVPGNSDMFKGDKSPVWKGGIHDVRWDRLQPEYKKWRISVFSRDEFICKKCNNKAKYLEAHHIKNWNDYPEDRYLIDNGITFCRDCHIEFHRIYGKKNNSEEQIFEFLQ
jgi:hypothetical protein